MKLRSLLLVGAGLAIGASLSRKLRDDDPNVIIGPAESRSRSNPALRVVSAGAQRIADRASVVSLDAIRRTRGAIRERLAAQAYDDLAWN
jgi:prephenate dehydrogenase